MIVIVDVVLTVLERSESVDPLLTKTVFVPPLTLKISTEYVVEDVVAGESKKVKNDTGESSKPDINLADPTVTLALDPAAFPIHSAVESLFSTVAHPTFSAAILMWQMTRILPVLLDGVIDADNPVTAVLAALAKLAENESVLVVLTTCNTLPAVLGAIFADVTANAAISSVVIHASGNPPAEMPVIVPDPAIEIGMT
jgi:hypothetical protein